MNNRAIFFNCGNNRLVHEFSTGKAKKKKMNKFYTRIKTCFGAIFIFLFAHIISFSIEGFGQNNIQKSPNYLTPEIKIRCIFYENQGDSQIEFLGYNFENMDGEINILNETELEISKKYYMTCWWMVKTRESFSGDFVLKIGNVNIARWSAEITGRKMGEVFLTRHQIKIPRSAATGLSVIEGGFIKTKYDLHKDQFTPFPEFIRLGKIRIVSEKIIPEHRDSSFKFEINSIIDNGSFEKGFESWLLGSWQLNIPGTNIHIDEDISYHGQNSLRIDFDGGISPNYFGPTQMIAVRPNTRYRLTYMIKTEDISEFAQGAIIQQMSNNNSNEWNSRFITGTNDWIFVERIFITDENTHEIRLRFRAFGGNGIDAVSYHVDSYNKAISGTSWFDCVALNAIPDN